VRRGREKVGIQAYLTAIVMNLKVLVGPFVTQRNQMVLWIIYGHHSVILVLHEVAESISRAETPYPARMAA
jgi:hypothetical protein